MRPLRDVAVREQIPIGRVDDARPCAARAAARRERCDAGDGGPDALGALRDEPGIGVELGLGRIGFPHCASIGTAIAFCTRPEDRVAPGPSAGTSADWRPAHFSLFFTRRVPWLMNRT